MANNFEGQKIKEKDQRGQTRLILNKSVANKLKILVFSICVILFSHTA